MFTSRWFVGAGTAMAIVASTLLASSAPASADTVEGNYCQGGTRGSACAEVDSALLGNRYAHAYAQAAAGHSICLLGIALYVQQGSDAPEVKTNSTTARCTADGGSTSMVSDSDYAVPCYGIPTYEWTAVTFQVDGAGAIGRFESYRVTVCQG